MPILSTEAITSRLADLPGWAIEAGALVKTYQVRSFAHGVILIGAIAQLAEAANHHPDLMLRNYNQLTVSLMTHSAGGVTEKDFELAAAIEALPQKPPKAEA
ncbi:MAG: 4a-hydroxytetrahydrobiopterin dehydratase [Anaerolineales bacterium]|nr:4a-hydroxytetrahydrobiopterin dehydratase [Anaerolineales bacterium]